MSDIQDLIHKTSMDCIERGKIVERERIIKLLEERFAENVDHCEWGTHLFLDNAIELIKGEK
jgi:hypothetical protein